MLTESVVLLKFSFIKIGKNGTEYCRGFSESGHGILVGC